MFVERRQIILGQKAQHKQEQIHNVHAYHRGGPMLFKHGAEWVQGTKSFQQAEERRLNQKPANKGHSSKMGHYQWGT